MSQTLDEPIAALPAPPSRRELRAALAPLAKPNTALTLGWLTADVLVWLSLTAAKASSTAWGWKLLAGLVAGVWTACLFIIGHDACHKPLTAHRKLNRVLGRIAFLPSPTPYRLWELGHNQAHHGFTNLRQRDGVWVPLSAAEYAELPSFRRALERVYRSGWRPGLYYAIKLWWKKLYFPRPDQGVGQRAAFAPDGALVTAFALVWLGALWAAATLAGTSTLQALLFGMVLPLLVWKYLMGFVIYVHRPEPNVAWCDDRVAWAASLPYLGATLHLQSPALDTLLHRILQHPAQHLGMTIPFYRLRGAAAASTTSPTAGAGAAAHLGLLLGCGSAMQAVQLSAAEVVSVSCARAQSQQCRGVGRVGWLDGGR